MERLAVVANRGHESLHTVAIRQWRKGGGNLHPRAKTTAGPLAPSGLRRRCEARLGLTVVVQSLSGARLPLPDEDGLQFRRLWDNLLLGRLV